MTDLAFLPDAAGHLPPLAGALVGLAAGGLVGLVHFSTLWLTAKLYASGGAGKAIVLQVARFAVLVAVFYGLARLGAIPLLSGALALVAVRIVVVRRLGKPT